MERREMSGGVYLVQCKGIWANATLLSERNLELKNESFLILPLVKGKGKDSITV
jgi:hypothetical protein